MAVAYLVTHLALIDEWMNTRVPRGYVVIVVTCSLPDILDGEESKSRVKDRGSLALPQF